jgi:hypothetical protein
MKKYLIVNNKGLIVDSTDCKELAYSITDYDCMLLVVVNK